MGPFPEYPLLRLFSAESFGTAYISGDEIFFEAALTARFTTGISTYVEK